MEFKFLKRNKFTGTPIDSLSFYLVWFLGNVKFGLVEGLDNNMNKDSSFIEYHYLLTTPYLLGELLYQI